MRRILRALYRHVINPALKLAVSPLFSRRYLRGRYFDESYYGWFKVWQAIWTQKVFGFNRHVPWPVSPFIAVLDPGKVIFDPDDMHNFWHFGCYYSNSHGGRITIGKGTWIAPNVGIITTNHDLGRPDQHLPPQDVVIGEQCWIGMNSIILPGVTLGDHTVVAAGSVVCRSFPKGYCVLAGVPALKTKLIEGVPAEQVYDPPLAAEAASDSREHGAS